MSESQTPGPDGLKALMDHVGPPDFELIQQIIEDSDNARMPRDNAEAISISLGLMMVEAQHSLRRDNMLSYTDRMAQHFDIELPTGQPDNEEE